MGKTRREPKTIFKQHAPKLSMFTIAELPAWETSTQVKPVLLRTRLTSLKVFEDPERDRIKVSSSFPIGNNVSLYLSLSALQALFDKLPNRFRASSVQGLSRHKRWLLIAFLIADERFGCCQVKLGGYTYIVKKAHPLYKKCKRKGLRQEENERSRILNLDL